MARSTEEWAKISTQNRWQGAIFKGHPDARVYVQCKNDRSPSEGIITFNQYWSLQEKGCLITQKLPLDHISSSMVKRDIHAEKLCVWVSQAGRENDIIEKNGWVFAEYEGAYVAIKCVEGNYRWSQENGGRSKYLSELGGSWMVCENEATPLIIEIAVKRDFKSLGSFMTSCLNQKVLLSESILRYKSLQGSELTFYTDRTQLGEVNGEKIDLKPKLIFDSPFIKSAVGSERVGLKSLNFEKELSFNSMIKEAK
jgi:hypothetical protein